jgi:hypothetical protein
MSLIGFKVLSASARAEGDLGDVVHDFPGVPSGKRASRDKTPPPPPPLELLVVVDCAVLEVLVVATLVVASFVVVAVPVAAFVEVSLAEDSAVEVELEGAVHDLRPSPLAERRWGFDERTSSAGFERTAAATALCEWRDQWRSWKESAATTVTRTATSKM